LITFFVLTYVTVVLLLLQAHVILSCGQLCNVTCMRQVWQVSNVSFYVALVF